MILYCPWKVGPGALHTLTLFCVSGALHTPSKFLFSDVNDYCASGFSEMRDMHVLVSPCVIQIHLYGYSPKIGV